MVYFRLFFIVLYYIGGIAASVKTENGGEKIGGSGAAFRTLDRAAPE